MNSTKISEFNGTPVVEMYAGGYTALVAYELGSNVIRLHDDKNKVEFFRFKADNHSDVIKQSAEVWGLPSLYLPNRFADGVLKTSDAVYQLPVNEKAPYNNHIHGFLQKRAHTLVEHYADDNCAVVKTKYRYDENDEFFEYFPVRFLAEFTFTLSECGLEHKVKFTNLSDKMMPMSFATHTTINSPFVEGGKEENIRLFVPVQKRCLLNSRCLPDGEPVALDGTDFEYIENGRQPVLQNVDNEMYVTGSQKLGEQDFHGVIAEDTESGIKIAYEVSDEYKFWIIWNDKGFNGYFCPEPMTAMIDAPNLDMPDAVTGYTEVKPQQSYEVYQRFFTVK
ncbi:MAG: aldose 1-epimerase [Oscillospiraceae bacterium]|nr:aldose 1-epimerase [Oscillospiraceae bacterium]